MSVLDVLPTPDQTYRVLWRALGYNCFLPCAPRDRLPAKTPSCLAVLSKVQRQSRNLPPPPPRPSIYNTHRHNTTFAHTRYLSLFHRRPTVSYTLPLTKAVRASAGTGASPITAPTARLALRHRPRHAIWFPRERPIEDGGPGSQSD
jgi:hypothetical protein